MRALALFALLLATDCYMRPVAAPPDAAHASAPAASRAS